MESGVIVVKKNGDMDYRPDTVYGTQTERLVGGWAKVYSTKRSHPSIETVSLQEYSSGKGMWRSKPATMIKKVAIVHALREAYPGLFGGTYNCEEMPEELSTPPKHEVSTIGTAIVEEVPAINEEPEYEDQEEWSEF